MGGQRHFDSRCAPVGDTDRVVWMIWDVTARRRAEQRLVHMTRLYDFLSHNGYRGRVDLVRPRSADGDRARVRRRCAVVVEVALGREAQAVEGRAVSRRALVEVGPDLDAADQRVLGDRARAAADLGAPLELAGLLVEVVAEVGAAGEVEADLVDRGRGRPASPVSLEDRPAQLPVAARDLSPADRGGAVAVEIATAAEVVRRGLPVVLGDAVDHDASLRARWPETAREARDVDPRLGSGRRPCAGECPARHAPGAAVLDRAEAKEAV